MYIQDNHLNSQDNKKKKSNSRREAVYKTSYKYLSILKYAALYRWVKIPNSTRV